MISTRLEKLKPYVPGEQPKDRKYIKLNANENPFCPPENVSQAVCNLVTQSPDCFKLYPDPDSVILKENIALHLNNTGGVLCNKTAANKAMHYKITPDMIFCGNGSDEVLSFVFYAFFDSDKPVITPEFSYSFYPVYAGYYGISLNKIPLLSNFALDTETMLAKSKDSTGMIFANPNAPTGIGIHRNEIREMLLHFPKDKVFVVDEAYMDFGVESALPLLEEFKNLVIVKTFSKSLAFAGMRLGYVVANPELVNTLTTVKNSFNHFPVDAVCQTAAIEICKSVDYYEKITCTITKTRDLFRNELVENGWNVLPSETNFIFASKPGVSGEDVYEAAKKAGILIRYFATPGLESFVRITIGTEEEMQQLSNVLKAI